jgi:hypothetical protein
VPEEIMLCMLSASGLSLVMSLQSMMWRNLVIDFGHELVTAIHTPLIWANQRPSPEEFTEALNHTNLSVSKVCGCTLHPF